MSHKVVEYKLVIAEVFTLLEQRVNEALKAGWQPYGNLKFEEFQQNPDKLDQPKIKKAFIQPMVKYEA